MLQPAVSGRITFRQSMVLFFSLMLLTENGLPNPKLNYMSVGHFYKCIFPIVYEVGIVGLDIE